MDPVVRPAEQEQGLGWKIETSLSLEAQYNIERMLAHAYENRGIWQPILVPKEAPAPEPQPRREPEELTVTNPRWEHIDDKRAENSPDATVAGDRITLMVDVSGAADGSRVTFKVLDTSISPPARVGSARGEVEGGVGKAEWEVKVDRSEPALEFEGAVRRVTSNRAEIPVGVAEYIPSF